MADIFHEVEEDLRRDQAEQVGVGLDEDAGTPYLTGIVELIGEEDGEGDLDALTLRVVEQFAEYRAALDVEVTELPDDPRVVSYLVAAAVILDLPERQQLLEAPTTADRLAAVAATGYRLSPFRGQDGEFAIEFRPIEREERIPVSTEADAVAAGERLGWDVVLKATADHVRHRPDMTHVWRNIDDEEEMRDAWQTTMERLVETREEPGFVVQRVAPVGVPVSVRGVEDPLFGPVVSFGMAGFVSDLLGDNAYNSGTDAGFIDNIYAVTGSVGKTGTKEALRLALGARQLRRRLVPAADADPLLPLHAGLQCQRLAL